MPRRTLTAASLAGALALEAAAAAEPLLGLREYLAQVEAGNPGVRASRAVAGGAPLKALEPDMIHSPLVTATYGLLDDRKEPFSPVSPDRTRATTWNLGLSKRFVTGTTVAASYGVSYTQLTLLPFTIPGLPPSLAAGLNFLPTAPFYDAKPSLTVSQSLLRDMMSGMTGSGIRAAHLGAAAREKAELFRARALLFSAEQAYWALSLARGVVTSKRASLERTLKLEAWTRDRVGLNLAEEADLLQARAAVKLRELDLAMAEQDRLAAARAFNQARGRADGEVPEPVAEINATLAAGAVPSLTRTGERLDAAAARLALDAARAVARATWYRSLPDLTAFASVAGNGHDAAGSVAGRESLSGDRPTYTVGAAFTAPLDLPTLRKVQRGYDADFAGAREQEAQARLAADQDWAALTRRWEDVASRLALAGEIEVLQSNKLAKETERFGRGRSTTFQLLSFEEDYSSAQLIRLRLGMEHLLLEAQARFFNAGD